MSFIEAKCPACCQRKAEMAHLGLDRYRCSACGSIVERVGAGKLRVRTGTVKPAVSLMATRKAPLNVAS